MLREGDGDVVGPPKLRPELGDGREMLGLLRGAGDERDGAGAERAGAERDGEGEERGAEGADRLPPELGDERWNPCAGSRTESASRAAGMVRRCIGGLLSKLRQSLPGWEQIGYLRPIGHNWGWDKPFRRTEGGCCVPCAEATVAVGRHPRACFCCRRPVICGRMRPAP